MSWVTGCAITWTPGSAAVKRNPMTLMQIAPVTQADLPALYQLFATAAPDRPDAEATGFLRSQYSLETFWAFLKDRQAYVAQQQGTALGFVVIARPTPDQMDQVHWFARPPQRPAGAGQVAWWDEQLYWIKMVAVLPTAKRQGVATALYHYLFVLQPQSAFITGLYEAPLNNRASAAFHLALGFARVGVIDWSHEGPVVDEAARRLTGIYYRPPEHKGANT